jgi:hypothetical protein
MKKVIVLLVALFGASMLVHAVTGQKSPPKAPAAKAQPAATGAASPTKDDLEKIDNGSGDDIDTVDEGDPANDKDPEADDTSTTPGKS